MAPFSDVKAALDGVNQATNDCAARVAAIQATLQDMITNGATPAQLQDLFDEAGAIKTTLTGIAADPNNPLPKPAKP